MGRYVADENGIFWYVESSTADEVYLAPYERRPAADDWRCYHEPSRSWYDHIRHCPPEISIHRPERQLNGEQWAAILSILSGETKEEWLARLDPEDKPTSPIGEEKQE